MKSRFASQRAAACFLSSSLAITSSSAFTATTTTTTSPARFLSTLRGASSVGRRPRCHGRQGFPASPRSTVPPSSVTSLYLMNWLQTVFGGGAYNLQIDYESLPFPGPELAQAAQRDNTTPIASPSQPHLELATFAGGCFWGLELAFQRVEGVEHTAAGYTQGHQQNPTYDQVGAGNTGHTEAVCVYFDPSIVSYADLLEVFFQRVDPTTVNGQGRDFGSMYRTGIYVHSDSQKVLANAALAKVGSNYGTRPIATECKPVRGFWPAEDYHQQYLAKGGRFRSPQSTDKNCEDEIRCYG